MDSRRLIVVSLIFSLSFASTVIAGPHPTGEYCELNLMNSSSASVERLLLETESRILERMVAESSGKKLEASNWKYVWNVIRRFWLPHYRRATRLLAFGHELRSDLVNIALFRDVFESEYAAISKTELPAALSGKLNEIRSSFPRFDGKVKDTLKSVYGVESMNDLVVFENSLDVYKSYRASRKISSAAEESGAGKAGLNQEFNQAYLDFEKSVDLARQKNGLSKRTLNDLSSDELELAYPVRVRIAGDAFDVDHSNLQRDTDVHYTIEHRHEETIETKDKDGNVTSSRTNVWYTDETITPSYSDVIYRNFSTGDRSTTGLDRIKSETREMANRESSFREVAENVETKVNEYVALVEENRNVKIEKRPKPEKLAEALKGVQDAVALVESKTSLLRDYAKMTDAQILTQWGRDDVTHFRFRNRLLLERYEAGEKVGTNIAEQSKRGKQRFDRETKDPDRSAPLASLRKDMVKNYIMKALTASAIGGTAYYYKDELKKALGFSEKPEY